MSAPALSLSNLAAPALSLSNLAAPSLSLSNLGAPAVSLSYLAAPALDVSNLAAQSLIIEKGQGNFVYHFFRGIQILTLKYLYLKKCLFMYFKFIPFIL